MMFGTFKLCNLYFILLICFVKFTNNSHIKGLDDSILFRINWPGQDNELLDSSDYEKLEMTTLNNEKFQCLIPNNYGESSENEDKYTGPNALELLMPLFKKKMCTLRLETFWTYELCHGQWIKQYHEGREESGQRFQDYDLGKTNMEQLERISKELDERGPPNFKHDVPLTKLEGLTLPYFSVSYTDGTICDLTGNPRVTKVLYVCYDEGRHSIFSIKETYTCEYEVIVLTSLLCHHPSYRPQEVPQTSLHCIPMQGGTKRPKNMIQIEAESLKLRTHGTVLEGDVSGGSVRLEVIDDDSPEIVSVSSLDGGPSQGFGSLDGRPREGLGGALFPPQPSIDKSLVEDFLKGDYCLVGGSGWWKYEFCYGKSVTQYHEEKDGSKYSITLGLFNFKDHRAWLTEHPSKRFKLGKTQVSHLYTEGDYCDSISAKRRVEVRLKCKEANSPSAVTLYLLEPKTCEYVLGVETPLICPLLHNADELGLLSIEEEPKDMNTDRTENGENLQKDEL